MSASDLRLRLTRLSEGCAPSHADDGLTPDQIAALRALLAEVDSESAQDQGEGQLSENGIADESGDASTLSKGKPMRRIHGPYQGEKVGG